jgi:hypothetical protein
LYSAIKPIHVNILNIVFLLDRTVALVILQLQSETDKPPAPENLNVENSPPSDTKADNVVFIAKQFNITEFQNDTVEIFLRESKGNRRRKRDAVDVYTLIPDTTYRIAQMNTDGFGVGIYKTLAKNDFVIFIFRPLAR